MQVNQGVNEYLTNPHEDHDAVIDRAITRLDPKITNHIWMGDDSSSWDIVRLFVKLRGIRSDFPSKSEAINDETHMIVSNLDFSPRPFIPWRLNSLIGLETKEFDNALSIFGRHVTKLADQGLLNP